MSSEQAAVGGPQPAERPMRRLRPMLCSHHRGTPHSARCTLSPCEKGRPGPQGAALCPRAGPPSLGLVLCIPEAMGPPSHHRARQAVMMADPCAACPAHPHQVHWGWGSLSSAAEATGQHPHVPPPGFHPTPPRAEGGSLCGRSADQQSPAHPGSLWSLPGMGWTAA